MVTKLAKVAAVVMLLASTECGNGEPPTEPLVPPDPALPPQLAAVRIVFQRSLSGDDGIFSMSLSGSEPVRIADGLSPDVSPDGRRIAFASLTDESGVYVKGANGLPPTLVARFTEGWASDPDWSPDGRRIAFVDFRGYGEGGYLVLARSDGSGNEELAGGWSFEDLSAPAWSPDGKRIAVSLGRDVWAVTVDGALWANLTQAEPFGGFHAVWSPDGTRIAFGSVEPTGSTIKLLSLDGSGVETALMGAPDERLWPTDWSPDGELLLLMKTRGPAWDGSEIWLLRLSDRMLWRITDGNARDAQAKFWPPPASAGKPTSSGTAFPPELARLRIVASSSGAIVAMKLGGKDRMRLADGFRPDVSPDGLQIAFSRWDGGPGIHVMNADGSDQHRIVAGGADEPEWSPDGLRIAYVADPSPIDGGTVTIVRADGSGAVPISSGWESMPAWSPDGERIAFTSWSQPPQIWDVSASAGGGTHRTASEPSGGFAPVWSPDGGRLAFGTVDSVAASIRVMGGYGSSVETVLVGPASRPLHPSDWSGDGDLLLVTRYGGGGYETLLLRLSDRRLWPLRDGDGHISDAKFWPVPPASAGAVR